MDPLSIAASTVPLLEAAGFITKTLYKLIKSYRTAETRIVGLCEELSNLTTFLQAVDKTLKGYGALDFALVEEDLWREIDQALVNCQLSLGELSQLVERIKKHTRTKGFAWKTRAVADLTIYDGELAAFRDKIHKSNWALQTILSTINVSLSLRSNTSQTKILSELSKLKSSFEEALRVSQQQVGGFTHHFTRLSDVRLAQNLWHLAEAAKHFHSAASSTASTIRADESNASVGRLSRTGSSLAGDFPRSKRERVEQFLRQGRCQSPDSITSPERKPKKSPETVSIQKNSTSSSHTFVSDLAPQVVERRKEEIDDADDDEEEEDDSDFEQDYISGLCELATESIKALDFGKAARLLSRVLASDGSSSETASRASIRTMKIQLAICYFLEDSWEKAEPLVTELARSRASRDLVVCNLLHGLAIAYLSKDKTDEALATCQQAFLGKKRLFKKHATDEHSGEYHSSLGLLRAVFDASDDPIRAEIFQRQLPPDFEYLHFSNVQLFVAQQQNLLRALFKLEPGATVTPLVIEGSTQTTRKSIGTTQPGYARGAYLTDPDVMSVRGDADDEGSPISPQAVKRGLNRIFGRMVHRRTSRDTLSSPTSAQSYSPPSSGLTRHRPRAVDSRTNVKKLRTVLKKRQELKPMTGAGKSDPKPLRWRLQDTSDEDSSGNSTPLENDAAFSIGKHFSPEKLQFRAELADTSRPPELPCPGLPSTRREAAEATSKPLHHFEPNTRREPEARNFGIAVESKLTAKVHSSQVRPAGTGRVHRTIEQVAIAFASISAAKDPDHRHAIKLELEILSRDLASTSNDHQLLRDINNTIKSMTSLEASKDPEIDDSGYESAEPPEPRKQTSPEVDDIYSASPMRERHLEGSAIRPPKVPIPFPYQATESPPAQVKFEPWSPSLGHSEDPGWTFRGPMDDRPTKTTISDPKTLEELAGPYEKRWRGPDIYSKDGEGARQRMWMQFAKRYLPTANMHTPHRTRNRDETRLGT